MSNNIEWLAVKDDDGLLIGGIAFDGADPVVVISLFDSKDANKDGEVDKIEWLIGTLGPDGLKGVGVAYVVETARKNVTANLAGSDGSKLQQDRLHALRILSADKLTKLGQNMIMEGLFKVYFSGPINLAGKRIGLELGASAIKEFAIVKGADFAAKKAFEGAVN